VLTLTASYSQAAKQCVFISAGFQGLIQIQIVHSMLLSSLLLNKSNSSESLLTISSKKCVKALNIMRVVAHTSWAADQRTLLHLYRSPVRYNSSVVYGSARESYLRIFPQTHALRLCLGAFRTSPASSMCVQANDLLLYIRRRMLSIQYSLRLGLSPSNPSYNTGFSPKFKNPSVKT